VLRRISQPAGWVDTDGARGYFLITSDAIQGCTFTTTVWTEKAKDLARICMKIDTFDSMNVLATFKDPGEEAGVIPGFVSMGCCHESRNNASTYVLLNPVKVTVGPPTSAGFSNLRC
jgi:hypothetical protein